MAFVDSALVARGKGDPRTLVAPVDYVRSSENSIQVAAVMAASDILSNVVCSLICR